MSLRLIKSRCNFPDRKWSRIGLWSCCCCLQPKQYATCTSFFNNEYNTNGFLDERWHAITKSSLHVYVHNYYLINKLLWKEDSFIPCLHPFNFLFLFFIFRYISIIIDIFIF